MNRSLLTEKGNQDILLRQIVTIADLNAFKENILSEIKTILDAKSGQFTKKWLKSYQVEELLGVSANTLLSWRNNGDIPYSQMGGIIYYDPADIENRLVKNKKVITRR